MIPRLPTDPLKRAQRKADLLLASELLRDQVTLELDDLGERANVWGRRWLWLRGWLADPVVLAAGGGVAAFLAMSGREKRGRLWRGLRWAWMAWKMIQRR